MRCLHTTKLHYGARTLAYATPMRRNRHPAAPARALGKDRGFFNQHVSFPMRDASPVELERFWAGATRVDVEIPPEHHWDCLGPNNIAGRVTALVIHPDKPQCWVAGSAAGGVWITNDAGDVVESDVEPLRAPEHRCARLDGVGRWIDAHRRHGRSQHVRGYVPGKRPLHIVRLRPHVARDVRRRVSRDGTEGAAAPHRIHRRRHERPAGLRKRVSRREHARGPLLRGSETHDVGGLYLRGVGRAQLQLPLGAVPSRRQDHLRSDRTRWHAERHLAQPRSRKTLGAADERTSSRRILPADQPRPRAIRSRRHLRARFQSIGPCARYLSQHQRRPVVERDPGRPVPERAADGLQQHDCRPSPPSRQRDLGRHEAAPHRQRRPQLAHPHEEGPRRQKLRARRPSRAALARRRPDPLRQRRRRLGQPRRRPHVARTQPPDGDDDVLRSRCRAVQREDLRRRDAGQRHRDRRRGRDARGRLRISHWRRWRMDGVRPH